MKEEDFTNSRVLDQPVYVPDESIFDRVTYSKVWQIWLLVDIFTPNP